MPKELIKSPHESAPQVEVGWSKGGQVQVGVIHPNLSSDSFEAGWTTTLDRDAVARLIKALHKATGQAHGPALTEYGIASPRGGEPSRVMKDRTVAEALLLVEQVNRPGIRLVARVDGGPWEHVQN